MRNMNRYISKDGRGCHWVAEHWPDAGDWVPGLHMCSHEVYVLYIPLD